MPSTDDMLRDLKEQADNYFSLASDERSAANECRDKKDSIGENNHLLLAMRYTSKAENLMHEYKRLGGM